MSSAEIVKPSSNNENEIFKEKITSKQYKCPNMKKKCYRKGSRICYTDLQNITMLKKIPEKDTSQISIVGQPEKEIYDKVDSYRSGESLFKTFTFEQTRGINDPETVKCIEFWKGVMQKNLAPIKCTLIESDKKKLKNITEERKKPANVSKNLLISEKSMEGEAEKIDFAADQEKIWSQALQEIRNRKLDKLKLYVEERCEYCRDPFTKSFADEMRDARKEEAAQIEALNDWKPKDEGKIKNQSKLSIMKRLYSKTRTATQTTEKADKITENGSSKMNSGRRNSSVYARPNQSESKLVANNKQVSTTNIETSTPFSQTVENKNVSAEDTTKTVNLMKISEVQVPDIKCPCDSDTCICPHRAASKKSRTSLVEVARQNMPEEDKSAENLEQTYDDTCICKRKTHPWETMTCSTEPCVGKQADIQESSSDFNLNRLMDNIDKPPPCICGKVNDAVCSSDYCKNKNSQDTLLEEIQPRKDSKENSCVCGTGDVEVPCANETCSTKPSKRKSGKCVCRKEKPWCEIKCQTWSCPINKNKIRRKQRYDEEEINLGKLTSVKEVTSTCVCDTTFPWKKVQCVCEDCDGKYKPVDTAKIENKRRPSSINFKKYLRDDQDKPKDKDIDNTRKNKKKCICSISAPWCPVTCETYCNAKEKFDKSQEKAQSLSIANESEDQEDDTCICEDKTLEPTCKAFKCKNRNLDVEYPPPCICPKGLEDTKHEHFNCDSENCKMKKIDGTCICSTTPGAPCRNKTCVTKPPASKTLKSSHKTLNYDTKCICKVRGFSTTVDVNCTASHCPFKRKLSLPKTTPMAVITIPHEDTSNENIEKNKSKCLCKTADTVCTNLLCRGKKKKRHISITEESGEDEEPESCICNDEIDAGQEVICRQVQCRKVSITEGGIVMNDKCVCATLDSPCSEPFCAKTTDKKIIEETIKIERPYCYICGHYDCASTKNREDEEVCGNNYSNNDINI